MPKHWPELDQQTQLEFLLGGKMKQADWYIDESNLEKKTYSREQIEEYIALAKNKSPGPSYGTTDPWLFEAIEVYPLAGLTVAIMGSTVPWYEAVTLAFGGNPTTIDYNLTQYDHPDLSEQITPEIYWKHPRQFDAALSISSFEHDGLGRYGDPLNPSGDLRAMNEMKKILKKDGILFLAVPVGIDKIVWNAHRIYGKVRLPMLIDGWEPLGTVGFEDDLLYRDTGVSGVYQPVIVLRNS
jgi:SAM-dependent methyltransferase